MSTQHTPGPWKVVTSWEDFMVEGPNREEIIFQDGPYGTPTIKQANARLIAAAPDLLEALKLAVLQNSHDMLMTGEELRKCEAAITKATGASHD